MEIELETHIELLYWCPHPGDDDAGSGGVGSGGYSHVLISLSPWPLLFLKSYLGVVTQSHPYSL